MSFKNQMLSVDYVKAVLHARDSEIVSLKNGTGFIVDAGIPLIKKFFPVWLEFYTTSGELVLPQRRGLRIIMWDEQRAEGESVLQKKRGWWQTKSIFTTRRAPTAYLEVRQDYFKSWSRTAKFLRNRWLKKIENKDVRIEKKNFEEFRKAYLDSQLKKRTKIFYNSQMPGFEKFYKEKANYFLVRDLQDKILGGVCIVEETKLNQAVYQYVFAEKSKENAFVGVGIIDFCMRFSLDHNYPFLNLTAIYEKGQDKSWRGLTKFKLKFSPKILHFKNSYFKIIWEN